MFYNSDNFSFFHKSYFLICSAFFVSFFFIGTAFSQSVTAPSSTHRVVDPTIYNRISSSGTTISVSGIDPVKVVVSATAGTLKITTTTGLTAPTGYTTGQWSGTNEIGFEGSLANVNNALATLQYLGSGTITVSPTSPSIVYSSVTGNFYEVSTTNKNWADAKADAESRTLGSATGYLATVTSTAEFTYIKNKAGVGNIWLGGSDSAVEGEWRWVGGPENGQKFWQGAGSGAGGTPVAGMWSDWNGTAEPNNSGNEDYLQITTGGKLNDLNGTSNLAYVIEYTGTVVSTSRSFTIAPFVSPDDAFAEIQNAAQKEQNNALVEAFTEQIINSNFTMNEKIYFHSQTSESEMVTTITKSFTDYNINMSDNNIGMIGEGKYHQTDVVSNQNRRRLMLDTKHILSKDDTETTSVSAFAFYDYNIVGKTSPQYRFGFKYNDRDGSYPLNFSTQTNSYLFGMSLSHRFSHSLYGGIYTDFIYRKMNSKYPTADATLTGKITTYNITSGGQLTGKIRLSPKWQLRPTFVVSYSGENLHKKQFISATTVANSTVDINLYLPTSSRLSVQPGLFYKSPIDSKSNQQFISFNPAFACERMKTSSTKNSCNTGVFFETGIKNTLHAATSKFYFNYENLNNGPRHEYGLQVKFKF